MEHRAGLAADERELERVKREIAKLIDFIKQGIAAEEIRDEINAFSARKKVLVKRLEEAEVPPPLLHPQMADVYRQRVTELCHALDADSCAVASEAIRQLVDAIVLEPEGDGLAIRLKGDLAGMLAAAKNIKKATNSGDLLVSVQLVAGACNCLDWQACGVA